MQILAIYGSPREEGNTDLMMDAFLEGAAGAGGEARRIYVRDLKLEGCMECGHCDETGSCSIEDDMREVYPLLAEAPLIVVSAPIFFYGVPGQLKLLVDRTQASYMRRELARKEGKDVPGAKVRKGFLLSAGATKGKRLFECAILTMKYFYDAIGATYAGEVCFPQIEERGAILQHPTALHECRLAGESFVRR